ncbi:hypothetical protein DICPUDRAFT_156272 [Dictyostelium purpureum]|uniref:Calponin-homology (CH) domain-containing protein n=1 Tax=Dictyostelium purpureum TaxID=5786 RepID=F0ZW58_DICPU|nr:uncharacterized protein DICPUDRAFT_156272 [Dictyostelium purpureum]EGC31824.1 hypothetical protein DICPUDRAFT_156272 [Dictyostelium purpureum]|eukprot:XP_003291658.1 hypothetical protein DICPUDRAFT_156272 [Dictyostelium purpureum]
MSAPNSTHGNNAVYREDGVRLYGMDAEIELKQRAKRDPQLEKELAQWIEKAIGEKLKYPNDLIESLRSGIVLCKLINTLLPGTIKSVNTRDTALHHMENIGLYIKACWKVGVESSDLFVASDLYLKKGVSAVIQNLASIARCAHNCAEYKGPTFGYKPNPNIQPAKKWDEIKIGGPVFVTDIENKENIQPPNCTKCGHEKVCQACYPPSSQKVNIISEKEKEREKEKEKEFLQKIQNLSNVLKEKEDHIKSLIDNLDKQKKKQVDDEKELKELIETQKTQIQSKENIIQSLNKTNSNLVLLASNNSSNNTVTTPPSSTIKSNSYVTPPTTTSTTSTSLANNANKTNRNSGVFQAVSTINNKVNTPSSSSTLNATTTTNTIKCSRCNSTTNKPTQKYCSCGELLKKDTATTTTTTNSFIFNKPPTTINTTTSSIATNNTTTPSYLNKNRNSTNLTNNTGITINNSNNSEIEKLNDKISTLCSTMKQQEETISRLNNQINSEKQIYEKEKKQQKQTIDNQQILLNQKEQDLKKALSSNTSSNTATNQSNKPFLLGAELRSINTNHSNDPSIYSKPYGSNIKVDNASNITTTLPSNSTIIGNKELETLRDKLKELEYRLNDEISKSKAKDSTIALLNEKVLSFNNRPKRVLTGAVSSAKSSQIVVGRKRFNTLKPDSVDITTLVDATLSHLSAILYNKPIEFYQVTSLKDLFKTETGRRRFTQILSSTLKQVPQLQLSETSFEFLLYLISCALQEMNISQDHDFQCARIIFHSSDSLYRVGKTGQSEFLKPFITSSPVFKDIRFWSDYFWVQLSKRHRKVYGKIPDTLDREIIINLLSYFGVNMTYFGISSDQVKEFINEMGSQNNLDKKQIDYIISTLKDSPLYQSINTNNDKQKNTVVSSAKVSKKDKDEKKKK